jgi:poly(hydroxyalkanoate) granule-associated protein
MATKPRQPTTSPRTEEPMANAAQTGSVKDSAQQIWQAGLGAFTRAQAEGSKAFEALVKEGVNIQRKTQAAAEERLSEATDKMASMASELSSKATGQWDKLETIFEARVSKALNKLGVPSAQEVNALVARIDELTRAVQALSAKVGPAPAAPRKVAARKTTTARKPPSKPAARN